MQIKPTGAILFVRDIQVARRFYEEILEQPVENDFGLNLGFRGGFALWQRDHAHAMIFGQTVGAAPEHNLEAELYFESPDLAGFSQRLETAGVEWIHREREMPWAQRVLRFYDPDGHIIELAEPMDAVIPRLLAEGMSKEEAARKTGMPVP